MAKSRRMSKKNCKKSRKSSRRQRRYRGGVAPVGYDLAQETMAKSLQQGQQYAQYHSEQHGGSAPFPDAVSGQALLNGEAVASAMQDGPMGAYRDIEGMKDPYPNDNIVTAGVSPQSGGRKRRGGKKHRKSHRRSRKQQRKSKKQQRKRQQGGYGMPPLGYDSVNAPGLLLSQGQYEQAGLNPTYFNGTSTEQIVAGWRDNA